MRHDVAVVGGGCVGCSVAKHLAERSDLAVCVIEKEHHLAQHQSGRNSGVLHPGFNYPAGSLKARFATEGTRRLVEYARSNRVPLEEVGSWSSHRTRPRRRAWIRCGPGLTSSLPFGDHLAGRVLEALDR